jgi:hypothetical protein
MIYVKKEVYEYIAIHGLPESRYSLDEGFYYFREEKNGIFCYN